MGKRFIPIVVLILILLGLSFYSAHVHPWVCLDDCLRNPEKHDGKIVTHYREPTIGEFYADGFLLLQRHAPAIRVYADTTGLISGEYVGMKSVFHKQGYLQAISLRMSTRRRYKIWVSVIPVLLTGLFLTRYFRINRKPFQIELRRHA